MIVADLQPFERQTVYGADITYGTNNEFGFDYLRDNMVTDQYDKVQRELNFAVVDEVGLILIDEARTPLIISGQADDNIQLYRVMDAVPAHLIRQETEEGEGDYWQMKSTPSYSERSWSRTRRANPGHKWAYYRKTTRSTLPPIFPLMHHLMAALRAHPVPQRPTLRHSRR